MDHVILHPGQQVFEHLLPLGPVRHQRVALSVGVKAYAGAQILHPGKVVDPMGIYSPQQEQPFQGPHLVRANLCFPAVVRRFRMSGKKFGHLVLVQLIDHVFIGQVRRKGADPFKFAQEGGHFPIISVAAWQMAVDQVLEFLPQHSYDLVF